MNFCGLPRTDVETAVGRPVDGRIRILGFLLDIDVTGISAESHRAFAARGVGIELEFDQIGSCFGVVDIQDANPTDSIIQKLAVHLLDGVARRELVAVFGNDRIGRIVPGQRDLLRGRCSEIRMPDQLGEGYVHARYCESKQQI